ncbi:hypothetical protein G7Y89_g14513 [Cudoniella acicularis]|uniref:F-box domain-containing protein n=1 Tax=Cudoniella acicularis TaxID=354080 RepID=A0A8H4R1D3_9HELO|nr:hypothetical protein G7Y89_g14513 [Cudoniella acicularis]
MASSFLTLPPELRLEIYRLAIRQTHPHALSNLRSLSSSQPPYNPILSLTLISHQIRREVLALILAKSRYFGSLTAFCDWVERAPEKEVLGDVRDVSISVTSGRLEGLIHVRLPVEDDLRNRNGFGVGGWKRVKSAKEEEEEETVEKVGVSEEDKSTARYWHRRYISQFGPPLLPPGPTKSPWNFNSLISSIITITPGRTKSPKHPMESAFEAFNAISNVRRLWLHLGAFSNTIAGASTIVADEQELILNMISTACTNVEEFTIMSRHVSLSYLRNFKRLRRLHFDGCSRSSPNETREIFKTLNRLEEVVLYRYPHNYSREQLLVGEGEYVSVTPEVLSSLYPLKGMRIWHLASDTQSPFLTLVFIRALQTHWRTLRRLQIVSDHPLEPAVAEALLDFIVGSRVVDLEVKVKVPISMGEVDVKGYLPATVGATRTSCGVSAKDASVRDLLMMASGAVPSSELTDYDLQIDWNR